MIRLRRLTRPLYKFGQSWTLPWAVTSPRDTRPLFPRRLRADSESRENTKGLGWYFLYAFAESDPWTCIVYELRFSYVNDILCKIVFDSFLRSDLIQKKNICIWSRTALPCSFVIDSWMKSWVYVRLSIYWNKTELSERKGVAWRLCQYRNALIKP